MFRHKYRLEVDGQCYEQSHSYSLCYVQQMKEKIVSDGAKSVNIYCDNRKMLGLCYPNPFNKLGK